MQNRKYLLKALVAAIFNNDNESALGMINLINAVSPVCLRESFSNPETYREEKSVLHLAVRKKAKPVAEKLLSLLMHDHDIIFFTEEYYQTTLFHLAAQYGCATIFSQLLLLAKQQVPDQSQLWRKPDHKGDTALHMAARHGEFTIVRQLLTEVGQEKNAQHIINRLNKDGSNALLLLLEYLHTDINFENLKEGYNIVLDFLRLGADLFTNNKQLNTGYKILLTLRPPQFSNLSPDIQQGFLSICREIVRSNRHPEDFPVLYSRYAGLHSLKELMTAHFSARHQVNPRSFTRLPKRTQDAVFNDLHRLALAKPALPSLRRICFQYASVHGLHSMLLVQHDFNDMPIRNTFYRHDGKEEFIEDDILGMMPAYREKLLLAEKDRLPVDEPMQNIDTAIEQAAERDRMMLFGILLEIDNCIARINQQNISYPYRNWAPVPPVSWLIQVVCTSLYFRFTTQPTNDPVTQLANVGKLLGQLTPTYIVALWGSIKCWNTEQKLSHLEWLPFVTAIERQVIDVVGANSSLISTFNYSQLLNGLSMLHQDQNKYEVIFALKDVKFNLNIIQENLTVARQPLSFFAAQKRKVDENDAMELKKMKHN